MSAAAAQTLERQRAEIVSRLETASRAALAMAARDPGDPAQSPLVHGFERYAAREGDLRKHYLHDGNLVGWHVRRTATVELANDAMYTRTAHRWRAVAVMALDDPDVKPGTAGVSSEIVFDRMLECARAAFRDDDALIDGDNLLAETTRYEGRQGFQIDDSGPAMFAGVLCHMARCSIVTVCSEPVGVEATDDFVTAGLDITSFSQDQRYLDGTQTDVGARTPPADDPDHDFEDVSQVRAQS